MGLCGQATSEHYLGKPGEQLYLCDGEGEHPLDPCFYLGDTPEPHKARALRYAACRPVWYNAPTLASAPQARELLLGRVPERARELRATFTPRPVRLAADMLASQRADIDYLLGQGFAHYESVYVMRRSAAAALPELPVPQGVAIRRWRMPSAAEQVAYLRAYNLCFPDIPKAPETLQFFLESPCWAGGTAVAAFDAQGKLAGSILAYAHAEKGYGVVVEVFVLPGYRRRRSARYLLGDALRCLHSQGITEMMLEVRASNAPAVALYAGMGYARVNEEVLLGRTL